ncbi:MAG TPA: fibronectin type III domain-containing protein [Candidatus Eisenbacteria bacterium]|nr:fibronectin type III domain-containing protein [Candidatus Eisenbacteria bacterium]
MRRPQPHRKFTNRRTTNVLPSLRVGGLAGLGFLALLLLAAPPARGQVNPDSSVVLQWTAPGDDGISGRASVYDIRYRTTTVSGTDTTTWWNGATQVNGEPLPGNPGTTDSMRVRGLAPLTTYYFMVRTGDEVPNWAGYSNLAQKSTSGDVTAPAAISTLAITSVGTTSLTLRWTSTGDDNTTGTAASYDVRYSTSSITAANFASATAATGEPAPQIAGTQQTFNLTGLTTGQVYYVAMKATDERGNVSVISNVVSGTPADTVAPAAVRDLSLGPDGTNAVDLALALLEEHRGLEY